MKKILMTISVILMTELIFPVYGAQQPSERSKPVYRLHFALHVVSGDERQTYNYELTLQDDEDGRVRALSKVPVGVAEGRIQYVETGTKLDAQYEEENGKVLLDVEIQFTSLSPTGGPRASQPTIREWQYEGETILAPGQSMTISRGEALEAGLRYELEARAEKLP